MADQNRPTTPVGTKPGATPAVSTEKRDEGKTNVDDSPLTGFVAEGGDVPTTSEVPDPRTESDTFNEGQQAGYAGRYGFDLSGVDTVAAKSTPVDVTTAVRPDSGGSELLAAAQAKAPNLTPEFVKAYGLSDDVLAGIARGEISPPPAIGPAHTSDLYLTPGGWQQTPPGVSPEQYGVHQATRTLR